MHFDRPAAFVEAVARVKKMTIGLQDLPADQLYHGRAFPDFVLAPLLALRVQMLATAILAFAHD